METVKVVDSGRRGWKIINKEDMQPSDKVYTDENPAGESKSRQRRAAKAKEQ